MEHRDYSHRNHPRHRSASTSSRNDLRNSIKSTDQSSLSPNRHRSGPISRDLRPCETSTRTKITERQNDRRNQQKDISRFNSQTKTNTDISVHIDTDPDPEPQQPLLENFENDQYLANLDSVSQASSTDGEISSGASDNGLPQSPKTFSKFFENLQKARDRNKVSKNETVGSKKSSEQLIQEHIKIQHTKEFLDLQKRLDEKRRDLQSLRSDKTKLQKSIQEEKDKVRKQEKEISNWKSKYEKLESQNNHQKKLEDVKKFMDLKNNSKVDQLTQELNSCKNEIEHLKTDKIIVAQENESQKSLIQVQVQKHENEIQKGYEQMILQLKNEHQKVVDDLNNSLGLKDNSIGIIDQLKRDINSAGKKIEELEKGINSQKCQILEKDAEITRLNSVHEKKLKSLNDEIASRNTLLSHSAPDHCGSLHKEIEKFKNDKVKLENEYENKVSQMTRDHQKVETELKVSLKHKNSPRLNQLTKELDTVRVENQNLIIYKTKLEKEIVSQKVQIASLTGKNDEIQMKYDKILDLHSSCSMKIFALGRQVNSLEKQVEEWKGEVSREKYQLFQKNKEIAELTGEIENLKSEIGKFKLDYKKISESKKKYSNKAKDLKTENKLHLKKIDKLETDFRNKCEEINRKVKILQDLKDADIAHFKFKCEKFEEGLPQEFVID